MSRYQDKSNNWDNTGDFIVNFENVFYNFGSHHLEYPKLLKFPREIPVAELRYSYTIVVAVRSSFTYAFETYDFMKFYYDFMNFGLREKCSYSEIL